MNAPTEAQVEAAAQKLADQDPNWARLVMLGATEDRTLMARYGDQAREIAVAVLNA